MPNWARASLANVGINIEFTEEELTEDQKEEVVFINSMIGLVKDGFVNVFYDPKTDVQPEFSLTDKGVKEAKKQQKR